ncbi:MAG: hypothetical protein ACTSSB_11360 [Candidatus Heimdallarchaeota archaeon]
MSIIKKKTEMKLKKAYWFALVGVITLALSIVVRESIRDAITERISIFGISFNIADFVFGLVIICGIIILFLFFPKAYNTKNKRGRL